MSPESLEDLMMLDVLGGATAEQQARLREALAKDSSLAGRHAALSQEVHDMEHAMGTAQSRQISSTEPPPIPAHVITQLEAARRKALASQHRSPASDSNVVAFPSSKSVQRSQIRNSKSEFQNKLHVWLARAALIALLGMVTGYWFVHEKGPPIASAALAPRGETGLTQPLIVWENKPDQKYDVWILPPEGSQTDAPALFTAKNVRSPVAFTDLKPADSLAGQKELRPGKPYRLLVCFATMGRLAGVTVPFQTSVEAEGRLHLPSDVRSVLLKAKRLLESGKPGDALMILTSLPENERNTPEASALETEARAKLPAADRTPRG